MTAAEGVEAAKVFPQATIVPIHFEDWAHFSEGKGYRKGILGSQPYAPAALAGAWQEN